MKKIVVLMVACGLLMGSTAMASSIVGSVHDLSTGGSGTWKDAAGNTEVCVFCHTPHSANTAKKEPLWNRSLSGTAINSVYNTSTTLTTVATAVSTTDIGDTDAVLCLSCHDGSSLAKPLQNPSNLEGQPTITEMTGTVVLDADFDNDHPIAFNYSSALSEDPTGLNAITQSVTPMFSGDMWCSSCHDVHDDANEPFLNVDNTSSGLCTTCHNK